MSEYEVYQVVADCIALALASLGIYMTVVSGFLAAAYTISDDVSNWQANFISIVFVCFCIFGIWGAVGYFLVAENLISNLTTLPFSSSLLLIVRPSLACGVLMTFGMVGSLWSFY